MPAIENLIRTPFSFGGVKKHKDDVLSAVPAAIKAVLDSIGSGGAYIVRSDISKFFTKIPKLEVRKIISQVIEEVDFLNLFDKAVAAELSNMKDLREGASYFPIEDIGVSQGNSLSPLLGNLLLQDFDSAMNALPNIRCIRYIDDFILLGPNKKITLRAFDYAQELLGKWQMTLASDKTEQSSSQQCFEFLGIEFNNGFLRPCSSARSRFLSSITALIEESKLALLGYKATSEIEKRRTVIRTLVTLSETMGGWGMHYKFCNDSQCLKKLDEQISALVRDYLSTYRALLEKGGATTNWDLLGIQALQKIEMQSFAWPKKLAPNSLPS